MWVKNNSVCRLDFLTTKTSLCGVEKNYCIISLYKNNILLYKKCFDEELPPRASNQGLMKEYIQYAHWNTSKLHLHLQIVGPEYYFSFWKIN